MAIFESLAKFAVNFNLTIQNVTISFMGSRFKFNSPIILLYSISVFIIHLLYQTNFGNDISKIFSVSNNTSWKDIPSFFLYTIGDNGNLSNISGPMMLLVIIGPIIEERIGSLQLLFISVVTAAFVGISYHIFFTSTLYGPTCIAYMLVFLASFVNVKRSDIPVSFIIIIIIVIFVGAERWSQNFREAFPLIAGSLSGMLWSKFVRKVS